MSDNKYDCLKLKGQLCFPLYAAARETIKLYKPHLDKLNLTYTQYIAMMLLWEKSPRNVKELGDELYLDSGTLTPMLKKLEAKGYIVRTRSQEDERNLNVSLTEKGEALKEDAVVVPHEMAKCVNLSMEECLDLYNGLYKLLGKQ